MSNTNYNYPPPTQPQSTTYNYPPQSQGYNTQPNSNYPPQGGYLENHINYNYPPPESNNNYYQPQNNTYNYPPPTQPNYPPNSNNSQSSNYNYSNYNYPPPSNNTSYYPPPTQPSYIPPTQLNYPPPSRSDQQSVYPGASHQNLTQSEPSYRQNYPPPLNINNLSLSDHNIPIPHNQNYPPANYQSPSNNSNQGTHTPPRGDNTSSHTIPSPRRGDSSPRNSIPTQAGYKQPAVVGPGHYNSIPNYAPAAAPNYPSPGGGSPRRSSNPVPYVPPAPPRKNSNPALPTNTTPIVTVPHYPPPLHSAGSGQYPIHHQSPSSSHSSNPSPKLPTAQVRKREGKEVVFLLDISGSMNYFISPTQHVHRHELSYEIVKSFPTDINHMITFTCSPHTGDPLIKHCGGVNKSNFEEKWDLLSNRPATEESFQNKKTGGQKLTSTKNWCSGVTRIMSGWQKMIEVRDKSKSTKVVLVTDGENSGRSDDLDQILYCLAAISGDRSGGGSGQYEGIFVIVLVVGFGVEHDATVEEFRKIEKLNNALIVITLDPDTKVEAASVVKQLLQFL